MTCGRGDCRRAGELLHIASIAALVAVVVSGCGGKLLTPSGFLNDYSALHKVPDDPYMLLYLNDAVDWKKYSKVMIDPVVVQLSPDMDTTQKARNRRPTEKELERMRAYFEEVLKRELGKSYEIVDSPAPDALRIRAAITYLVPARPEANVVTILAVLAPLDMGEAGIEYEILDSVSGERIVAAIEYKKGSYRDVPGSFTRWGHIRRAFRRWAVELRESLDARCKSPW